MGNMSLLTPRIREGAYRNGACDFEESLRKEDFDQNCMLTGNRHNVMYANLNNSYLEK